MFLVPLGTLASIRNCEIIPSILSDHSFVTLEIEIEKLIRGPGYWKFNNKLLEDKEFIDEMNKLIMECKQTNTLDPAQFWESLKLAMQNLAMDFSKLRAYQRKKKINELTKKLRMQEKKLACINLKSETVISQIEKVNLKIDYLKDELQKEYNYKVQGAMM